MPGTDTVPRAPNSGPEKRPDPSAFSKHREQNPMAATRTDPPGDVPEELTARDPFAYRAVWQPAIEDQGVDIGGPLSGRSVVIPGWP